MTRLFVSLAIVVPVACYAVYFDYRRRNDPEFRKQISNFFLFLKQLLSQTKVLFNKNK